MSDKSLKQEQFNRAMQRYHDHKRYPYTYKIVSLLNVGMQLYLVSLLFTLHLTWYGVVGIFLLAYFLADFINGYVHLYMDNNQKYDSIFGPFIASFHLHHQTPNYREFPIYKIYFNESGSKFWLVPFLIMTIILSFSQLNDHLLLLLILIGILSSVAEVSHFLCHNSQSNVVLFLQKIKLLLPMEHHINHHKNDNQSYAFLNGTSDFLLDRIAKQFYNGYKEHSDLDATTYRGEDTGNR